MVTTFFAKYCTNIWPGPVLLLAYCQSFPMEKKLVFFLALDELGQYYMIDDTPTPAPSPSPAICKYTCGTSVLVLPVFVKNDFTNTAYCNYTARGCSDI
jgi:hypothetical protein